MKLTTPVMMYRDFALRVTESDAAIEAEGRTFRMTIATETPVFRGAGEYGFDEILLCRPEAVDLTFLASSHAPLCRYHDLRDQVGVIDSAEVAELKVRGVARLSQNPEGEKERVDIRDGIRSCVSVGYVVLDGEYRLAQTQGARDQLIVTKWRPVEVSLCSVPLDANSGVGRAANEGFPREILEELKARSLEIPAAVADESPASTEAVAEVAVATPETPAQPDASPEESTRAVEPEPAPQETAPANAEPAPEVPTPPLEVRAEEPPAEPAREVPAPEVDSRPPEIITPPITARAVRPPEVRVMEENELLQKERSRAAAITAIAEKHNLVAEGRAAVASGQSADEFGRLVLNKIEERQTALASQPQIDLTAKDRARYSLRAAINQIVNGNQSRSFEREVSEELVRKGARASTPTSIMIPQEILGQRAVSQYGSGTGGHLVPQTQMPFLPHLVSSLAAVRAGVRVLSGLVGEFDFPSGDSLGTAGTPGESASQADSEATFRNYRATPRPIRSRAAFSKTLLNNSSPAIDSLIEDILVTRSRNKIESQIYAGTGTAQFTGVAAKSGVGSADLAGNAVTYPTLLNMITVVDNAKGLVGPGAFITTRGVVNKGLSTYRGGTGDATPVIRYMPGTTDEWAMDGERVLRTHEVKSNYASPTSPSQLIAHGVFYGVWSESFLCMFGPQAFELMFDPYTLAATGEVVIWIYTDADYAIPRPEVFAFADNVLL